MCIRDRPEPRRNILNTQSFLSNIPDRLSLYDPLPSSIPDGKRHIDVYKRQRVFCAGVCPFGALQELVNVKNYRISKAVTATLGIIPWLYLIFAVLYAVTRSRFIICQFDPFIGIFRLGGDVGLLLFGALLLIRCV